MRARLACWQRTVYKRGALPMTKQTFASMSLFLGLLLAACQSAAPAAAPKASASSAASSSTGWDQLIAAGNAEGVVNLYSATLGGGRDAELAPFKQDYPSMDVKDTFAPPGELLSRVQAERAAGKYLADVMIGFSSQSWQVLK